MMNHVAFHCFSQQSMIYLFKIAMDNECRCCGNKTTVEGGIFVKRMNLVLLSVLLIFITLIFTEISFAETLPPDGEIPADAGNFAASSTSSPTETEALPETVSSRSGSLSALGFVSLDLDEILRHINMQDTDVVKYYDPDPSEFFPMCPPFLKMDIKALSGILETVKKYNWEFHGLYGNILGNKECQITLVCQDTVITDLNFGRDADGRGYVQSSRDSMIAHLTEEDYHEIKLLFEAAPEWPEKYYERFGYRHYSEYPGYNDNSSVSAGQNSQQDNLKVIAADFGYVSGQINFGFYCTETPYVIFVQVADYTFSTYSNPEAFSWTKTGDMTNVSINTTRRNGDGTNTAFVAPAVVTIIGANFTVDGVFWKYLDKLPDALAKYTSDVFAPLY